MSCSRTQRSDAGAARTRGPSVSSQALFFCAYLIFYYIFGSVELDIIMSRPHLGCLHCEICDSNRFYSSIFKLCIMILHTLKMYSGDEGPEQILVLFPL